MAKQVRIRRGTADQHTTFVGAIGEVTMDTTNKTLRVHDGAQVGGIPLARQNDIPSPKQFAVAAMPSTRYVEFELGANGSTYTAPANGYVSLIVTSASDSSFITMYTRTPFIRATSFPRNTGYWGACFLPVNAGNSFVVEYGQPGTVQCFRFYYANGEN